MDIDEQTTPSEAATTKVAKLQATIDTMMELDPAANSLKELRKELEAAKRQTGTTAQSKTFKDLHATAHQLNLHLDTVMKDQQTTRQAHDAIWTP